MLNAIFFTAKENIYIMQDYMQDYIYIYMQDYINYYIVIYYLNYYKEHFTNKRLMFYIT